jgi:hypothetical protein
MEIWRQSPYYPEYEISNLGNLRHKENKNNLKYSIHKKGYPQINLKVDGKRVCRKIHRLVAEAFIPNPERKPQVNHINGDKFDNRVENLEWVTNGENGKHAYRTGLKIAPVGENHQRSLLTNEQVIYIFQSSKTRRELAEKFNVSLSTITAIWNKHNWSTTTAGLRRNSI